MMKTRIVKPVVVSLALLLGGSGAQAAGRNVLFACTGADGSIAVSSEATGDNCEQIAAPADAAASSATTAPTASAKPNAAAASRSAATDKAAASSNQDASSDAPAVAAAADLPPMETRLSNYRDSMLQGASKADGAPAAAANPAVSRRYLMTNRSAYRAAH